ncbi:hypothetical protein [Acidicapsa acidisoli]|uniref:hypothetical protein n=1 Tax=Acidicapsa acidisoli TaxID=1615681 RepID=UPI0021E0E0AA|nr:hypothetical protein [Acidicapsa acidisoli]
MLYLMPPFHMIEGITLFPDHEPHNPDLFYYLPSGPRLSVDPATKQAVFHALQYTGSEAGSMQGGYLSFQTDLGVEDEAKDKVRRELARRLSITRKKSVEPSSLNLVPLPVSSGSVQLMLYDAGEKGAKTSLVDSTRYSQTPSLYGDNTAIFSVNLTRNGMELVNQAIKGGRNPPIGVIYTLSFVGLQPAYSVKVKANWTKVYERFASQTKKNYLVYHEDIKKEVSKLTDEKTFEIDVTKMIEAGVDASMDDRVTMVVNRLTDMVTNKFFTPVLSPEADKGTRGSIDSLADSIGGLFSKIGSLGYTFNEEDVNATTISELNAEVRERVAVKRMISPSAFLEGLRDTKKFPEQPVETVVFGKDRFFQFRTLKVRSSIDFATNDIQSIDVDATYLDFPPKTLSLTTSDAAPADWSWARDAETDAIKIDYTVRFKDDPARRVPGRPPMISMRGIAFADQVLYVAPQQDLFNLTAVDVRAEYGFPWDRYPRVEVDLRPADSRGESAPKSTITLTKEKSSGTFRNFSPIEKTFASQFRVRYTGDPLKGGDGFETPWKEWGRDLLEIADPRPYVRTLAISGAEVDWANVRQIDLALRYTRTHPLAPGLKQIKLTPKKTADAFSYFCDSSENKLVSYGMKITPAKGKEYSVNGSVWEDELSLTGPGVDGSTQVLAGRRAVRIGLAGEWDSRFDKIQVTVRHSDQDDKLDDAEGKSVFSRASSDPQVWEYFFLKPDTYRYKVEYIKDRAVVKTVPFVEGDKFELQIPASPR